MYEINTKILDLLTDTNLDEFKYLVISINLENRMLLFFRKNVPPQENQLDRCFTKNSVKKRSEF